MKLQRVLTDFGCDDSFEKATSKVAEHYGVSVPVSSVRIVTEKHACKINNNFELYSSSNSLNAKVVIGETDGTMIPIVKEKPGLDDKADKRKYKDLIYREARLSLAYRNGDVHPFYRATLGDKEETGKQLKWCAKQAGMNSKTTVHCVGDGAKWIASQVQEQFGKQGSYLIDFYHLCEYLGDAAKTIYSDEKIRKKWIATQKKRMKQENVDVVLDELKKYMNPDNSDDLVFACYRYIQNRLGQFSYKNAIDNNLPIGSGRIESGHRHVIQKRLKIPGAWWKENNAQDMLALRTLVANDNWNQYWKKIKTA